MQEVESEYLRLVFGGCYCPEITLFERQKGSFNVGELSSLLTERYLAATAFRILVHFTPEFQFVTSCGFLPVSII